MIMTPFIIFAVVLTIAYVLYYATIITMDLNAKSKKEGEHEETISAGDDKEAEEEYTPQTVVEDTKTGGFSFIEVSAISQEDPVEEAEEPTDMAIAPSEEKQPEVTDDTLELKEDPLESNEDDAETKDGLGKEEDDDQQIPTTVFSENVSPDEKQEELFDESKVFDQDLAQPQYTVSTIITNEKDAALLQHIESINQRLVDCTTEGGLRNPMQLVKELRENREHSNIDFKDEYTQC